MQFPFLEEKKSYAFLTFLVLIGSQINEIMVANSEKGTKFYNILPNI